MSKCTHAPWTCWRYFWHLQSTLCSVQAFFWHSAPQKAAIPHLHKYTHVGSKASLSDASFPNWFHWVGDPVWNCSRSIYWGLKYLYKTCYRSSGPPSCCTGCTLQVSLQNSLKRRCHQKLNPAQLLSWFLLNMLHWWSWQLTGRCSRRRICRRSISKFSQVLR